MQSSDLKELLAKASRAYAAGDRAHSIEYYKQALAIDEKCTEAHEWLGELYVQENKLKTAVTFYEKALRLNPQFAEYANLGYCYYELGEPRKAVSALQKALATDKDDETSHSNYGKALYDYFVNVDAQQARAWASQWRKDFPHSKDARFMGAALSGEAIPKAPESEFVRETFDDFAEDFDIKLAELEYAAPSLLAELTAEFTNPQSSTILDLGCGTGLLGEPLRRLFPKAHITGIDLSAKMLQQAKRRNIYDSLQKYEITAWLQSRKKRYDIIIAADVFCYFGELTPIIQAAYSRLKPQGFLIFSLERADPNELTRTLPHYTLHVSGRYRHADNYPKQLANSAKLNLITTRNAILRTEYAAPVFGTLAAMQRV